MTVKTPRGTVIHKNTNVRTAHPNRRHFLPENLKEEEKLEKKAKTEI